MKRMLNNIDIYAPQSVFIYAWISYYGMQQYWLFATANFSCFASFHLDHPKISCVKTKTRRLQNFSILQATYFITCSPPVDYPNSTIQTNTSRSFLYSDKHHLRIFSKTPKGPTLILVLQFSVHFLFNPQKGDKRRELHFVRSSQRISIWKKWSRTWTSENLYPAP